MSCICMPIIFELTQLLIENECPNCHSADQVRPCSWTVSDALGVQVLGAMYKALGGLLKFDLGACFVRINASCFISRRSWVITKRPCAYPCAATLDEKCIIYSNTLDKIRWLCFLGAHDAIAHAIPLSHTLHFCWSVSKAWWLRAMSEWVEDGHNTQHIKYYTMYYM